MCVKVAIALVHWNNHLLVGHRGPGGPLPGYDEFPGGKCFELERPSDCAIRECREETGLVIEVDSLRHAHIHDYPHGRIHLHFFDCRPHESVDPLIVTNGFHWVLRNKLVEYRFPEANEVVLNQLM